MIELVLFVCTSAGLCKDVTIGVAPTRQACVQSMQMTAAEWIGNHPSYEIRKLTCRSMQPGRDA